MDQNGSIDGFEQLSVQQIASKMGVSTRTVYSHIEREGWEKKEGARGRVFYMVPSGYIEEYKRSLLQINEPVVKDQVQDSQLSSTPIQTTSQQVSQPDISISDRIIEQINAAHEGTLKAKDDLIAELKERIEKLEADKSIMNRQIEASNNAIVTMKEARRMQEEAKGYPGWMFWKK